MDIKYLLEEYIYEERYHVKGSAKKHGLLYSLDGEEERRYEKIKIINKIEENRQTFWPVGKHIRLG